MIKTLLLFLITGIWGISYIFVKDGINEIHYDIFQFWRYFIASGTLLLFFWKKIKTDSKTFFRGLAQVGIPTFLAAWFAILGMNKTNASQTAFFCGLSVVVIPILLFLHKKQKTTVAQFIGVLLSIIGVFLITDPIHHKVNIGILFLILSAISYGYQYINVSNFVNKANPYINTFLQCFTAFLGFMFLTLFDISLKKYPLKNLFILNHYEIINILFVGIVVGALLWLALSYVQKDVNPVAVGVILATEPFFTLLFEWIINKHPINKYELIGGFFIVLASIMISVVSFRENK